MDAASDIVRGKKTLKGSGVKFGSVNLEVEERLGSEKEITLCPTIRMYKPDGSVE